MPAPPARDSCRLKIPAARIRDCEHNRGNGRRFPRPQRPGGGLQCHARRHYIVDDQNMLAADFLGTFQGKSIAQILKPLHLRMQMRLRLRVPRPRQRLQHGPVAPFRQDSRDQSRLIESAAHAAKKVQRDRHHYVCLAHHFPNPRLIPQPPGQSLSERPSPAIFHLVNQVLERLIKRTEPQDPLIMGDAIIEAKRTWCIKLCQRHRAFLTRRGNFQ